VDRLVLLELLMVIAERVLSVVGEPDGTLVVRIGQPRPSEPEGWACDFAVVGLEGGSGVVYGVDSLQALQNAVDAARVTLKSSRLVCTWAGGVPGEVGLPRTVPTFEGSGFREKIERHIDRELRKFVRWAKRSRGRRRSTR
jgi:hypothetical protein